MASFSLVVEDSSPLISYAPAGIWEDTTGDPLQATYQGKSFHSANTRGATASFSFNGTAVRIFGARRAGYGSYTFSVDGQVITTGDASSNLNVTRQMLGAASGLDFGKHTAVLASNGDGVIDLDWIEFETEIGSSGTQLVAVPIDDASAQVSYSPKSGAWETADDSEFMDNTVHFTDEPNASASITFTGEAIALYGSVSPGHADMRLTIDGQGKIISGGAARSSAFHPKVLLYFASQLEPKEHKLVLSAAPQTGRGSRIDLDSFSVFKTVQPGTGSPSPEASFSGIKTSPNGFISGDSTPVKHEKAKLSLPLPAVIGAAVGGVLVLFAILGLILFAFRRRRRAGATTRGLRSSPLTPELPMQRTPTMAELGMAGLPTRPEPSFNTSSPPDEAANRHSIAPSYYGSIDEPLSRTASRTSSINSMTPMLGVPRLNPPQIPKRAAVSAGGPPARPKRPPTLNFLS